MSKKNKCVGLDCEMCGNTKCPNEEKETIINGIDVSECNIRFNHFGKIICELGNRKLGELHYLCSENPNCFFKQLKRLEKENEELKEMLSKEPKAMQAFQISYSGLKKENEVLWGMVKEYKTALEEIRYYANTLHNEPLMDGSKIRLRSGMYRIKSKIDEVLNDRD